MTKKTILLFSFLLSLYNVFSQKITGKWYETQNPNASLEIDIERNNDNYFGTFTNEWKVGNKTFNKPTDKVIIKNDSLLIELNHTTFPFSFKLKKDAKTETYNGFFLLALVY